MKSVSLTILGPADLENKTEPRDAVAATVDFINAVLSDPQQRSEHAHAFMAGQCYRLDFGAKLTLAQAQELLAICKAAGWQNVQVLYSLGTVTVTLSNEGNYYWPSNYSGQPFSEPEPAVQLMAA